MTTYAVRVERDVRIPTSDDAVTLSGDLYRPETVDRVPALLMILPYRKDAFGGGLDAELRWFASRGYALILVDFRGTGSSDGMQRGPFDAREADDAIDAINWLEHQPWCTGKVGMWGMSYGSIMTMRTASHQPANLTAIIALEGVTDPERDFVHPGGHMGCMGSLSMWGSQTLLNQLIPPLHMYASAAEQRRWRDRLEQAEPWVVDFAKHPPGHPVWRARAIDASRITVPALCISGWRDLFCDASVRAYEQMNGPKKLLAGPWMHTLPHGSPFNAIDFNPIALRWWDHWLKDIDTGVMNEPPVTMFVQGKNAEWRQFDRLNGTNQPRTFSAANGAALRSTVTDQQGDAAPELRVAWSSDRTVGALSGLTLIPTSGFGLPLDQHDDDMRSLHFTTDPLPDDLTIIGRPTVRLRWDGAPPQRIVARLSDVSPTGVSTFITSGMLAAGAQELTLTATCYRLAEGHSLRLILSENDFPRLWPIPAADSTSAPALVAVELSLDELNPGSGNAVDLPSPQIEPSQGPAFFISGQPKWTISRDLIRGTVTVDAGQDVTSLTTNGKHRMELCSTSSATSSPGPAQSATAVAHARAKTTLDSGQLIDVHVTTHHTAFGGHAAATITIDGMSIYSRTWSLMSHPMHTPPSAANHGEDRG